MCEWQVLLLKDPIYKSLKHPDLWELHIIYYISFKGVTNWICSAVNWRLRRITDNTGLPAPHTVNPYLQANCDASLLLPLLKPHQSPRSRSACITHGQELSLADGGTISTAYSLCGCNLVLHHTGFTVGTCISKFTSDKRSLSAQMHNWWFTKRKIILAISLLIQWSSSQLVVKQNKIVIHCWDSCPTKNLTQDNFILLT